MICRCEVSAVASLLAREHALAVHSNEYVKFIEALRFSGKCPKRYNKYIGDPSDFVYNRGTPTAAFLAAGAVVKVPICTTIKS
jgi:acetoin utilization deacetylase AcuC-like enzyme